MSVRKLALLAKVSVATVSRVLNNNDKVKPESRERVLSAIKELNYQPNLIAKNLSSSKSNLILVVVPDVSNVFHAEIIKSIIERAEGSGYNVLLYNTFSLPERLISAVNLLKGCAVDAMISLDILTTSIEIQRMIGSKPWVQCCEYSSELKGSFVGIDIKKTMRMILDYIKARNRTKTALIYQGRGEVRSYHKETFELMMKQRKEIFCKSIGVLDASVNNGLYAMNELLKYEIPDSVIVSSDVLAIGAVRAVKNAGFKINEDIDIVVFNNNDIFEVLSESITVVQQSALEIGCHAVSLTINSISEPCFSSKRKMVSCSLISIN